MNNRQVFVLLKTLHTFSTGWFFSICVLWLIGNGLNLFQANSLNVIYMSVTFALDPYSGKIADIIGQKRVYILGIVFWGISSFVYGGGSTYLVFALSEILAAIGTAMMSEALESWLANTSEGEAVVSAGMAKSGWLTAVVMIPSAVAGSWIGSTYGLTWPWILSGISFMIEVGVAYFLLRHRSEGDHQKLESRQIAIFTSVKDIWQEQKLRRILVFSFFFSLAIAPFNMFWPPILKELAGGQTWWFGILWIPIAIAMALGSAFSVKPKAQLWMVALVCGVPLLLPYLAPTLGLALITVFVHEMGRGAIRPLVFRDFNRHVIAEKRSTTNSIRSSVGYLGNASGLLLSGLATFLISPTRIWVISALVLVWLGWYIRPRND